MKRTPPQPPPHKGEGLNLPTPFSSGGDVPARGDDAWGDVSAEGWPLPLVGRGFGAGSLSTLERIHV